MNKKELAIGAAKRGYEFRYSGKTGHCYLVDYVTKKQVHFFWKQDCATFLKPKSFE